jgi:hypothetical protein
MADPRPDRAVARHLADNVVGLTLRENLFNGPMRKGDGLGVFCILDGGLEPEVCHQDATTGSTFKATTSRPTVQVRLRGDKGCYDDSLELAEEIRQAIHLASISGYIDVRADSSSMSYLGQDNDGHPEWTINVGLVVEE